MSGVVMFDRTLGRPNLPVPDNLLEAHFSRQLHEHIEQPVADRLFDRAQLILGSDKKAKKVEIIRGNKES